MPATRTETRSHPAIGRSQHASDILDPRPARHMQLALDEQPSLAEGDPLPPLWHYLYFNPQIRSADLAPDGHERLGGFLPDLGLPRRMWAGGRIEIAEPLRIGERADKTSTIEDVRLKDGRSGQLGFVTVLHRFTVDGAPRMSERQTIVYRAPPAPGTPPPQGRAAPQDAEWQERIVPDPILLFRYSALIFYAHRIHYDADYTRDAEGYPGLLVHGPLTATLLVRAALARMPDRRLAALDIRAEAPLFAGAPVTLEGAGTALRARTPTGGTALCVDLAFAD